MLNNLDERKVRRDPIEQFNEWYSEAVSSNELRPDVMTLATATRDGKPSARIVLLKGADPRGFVFYTNYTSRKGEELARNPHGALVLFWRGLNRQIRMEGVLEQVSPEESDEYFASRPRESQIGAVTSPQSAVIPDREELDKEFLENEERFRGQQVPRPPQWGGFRLMPSRIEFWQGREARLHDRIEYLRREDGGWTIRRLAP
jgi:pyridoxamine 5'-phosphate oxidase